MSSEQTLRQWLTSDVPTSRRQAKLAAFYQAWLAFRGNFMAMIGLGILLLLVFVATFAPWLAPHDPLAQDLAARLQPPLSEGYFLGSDSLGRDILSRLIYGSRITLYI
ncbi:MAG: peptide/nickel transport system permease protein, partial [Paracoccaceae bacterium]